MTLILPGADIHSYYQDLGVSLPHWATHNAAVRCFAHPDAHAHDDHNPSASVNLTNGAFLCHACGARGGAYDAALSVGHSPRSAIELMIHHGLIERRARITTARQLVRRRPVRHPPSERVLHTSDQDVRRWQTALAHRPQLILRLARERGWTYQTMRAVELGWDRGRITIPIRDGNHHLTGVLRYVLTRSQRPKMLAVPGTELGLIPHPAVESSPRIVLVEGPPDMIAARSRGIPAIAVPGDHAWKDQWAVPLADREITIVMDADDAGRAAAQRIHDALSKTARASVIDLAPGRNDGYDVTDWLCEHGPADLAPPTPAAASLISRKIS